MNLNTAPMIYPDKVEVTQYRHYAMIACDCLRDENLLTGVPGEADGPSRQSCRQYARENI
jgi:hypothetical protein